MLAPADDDTPLPRLRRGRRPRGAGALQRLGGPAHLRPADRRAGRPLDRAGPVRRRCTCTSRSTPSVSLLALWAAEGPIVATFHTANLRSRVDAGRLPAAAARAWRRSPAGSPSPRTPGAPSPPPRRRRGRHPQRRLRRPVRRARCPRPQWQGTPQAPTIAFLGPDRRAAQGPAGAARGAAAGRWRPYPGVRVLVAGHGDERRRPATRLAPEVSRRLRVPRRGQRRGQGRAAALGRPLRRAAHRRRELRHRAGRGDERGRAGAGQRPAGVPPGAGRRRGGGAVRQRGRRRPGPARCSRCWRDPVRPGRAGRPRPQARPTGSTGRSSPADVMAVYETVTSGAPRVRARRPSRPRCGTGWSAAAGRRPGREGPRRAGSRSASPSPRSSPGTSPTPRRAWTAPRPGRGRAAAPWTPSWYGAPRPPSSWPTPACSTRPARCCWPAPPRSRWRPATSTTPAARRSRATSPTCICRSALGPRRAGRDCADATTGRARRPCAGSLRPTTGCSWPAGSTTTRSPTCGGCGASGSCGWFRLAGHAEMPRTFEIDDELAVLERSA